MALSQLSHRIEYLRKEHQELLNVAGRLEKLLELASKNEVAEHLKSLTGLRSLEHGLAGIVEHCHAENRIVESTYHQYLQAEERARIDAEHEQIIRAVTNFREELKFATTDRTMAMILPGMDVVNLVRAHIVYEREMLGRIEKLENAPTKPLGKQTTGKKAHRKPRRHIARRKPKTKVKLILPYTLEPHPEL
jgi:hypothetical protein